MRNTRHLLFREPAGSLQVLTPAGPTAILHYTVHVYHNDAARPQSSFRRTARGLGAETTTDPLETIDTVHLLLLLPLASRLVMWRLCFKV